MTKLDFLNKLMKEGALELVEPSDEICASYLQKADNCLKSAKILLENLLSENSISMSYYAMYNSLTALLFKTGIKCENHFGSILILKILFQSAELFSMISFAKEERIDKQYYVTSSPLIKESALEMTKKAEDFLVKIKLITKKLNFEDINRLRTELNNMLKN